MRATYKNLCLSFFLTLACLAQSTPAAGPGDPIATVGGQPIYQTDLESIVTPQLRQLQNQEFQIRSRALDAVVQQRLVEAEAKKRGLTADKLLEQEVDAKVSAPTAGEVEAFYLAQRDRINRPLAEIRPQVEQALRQAKIQQARQQFTESLREKIEVVVLLRQPRTEVAFDPTRVKGDAQAAVTIVEFSDFQCPFCKRVEPTLSELMAKYKGKVRLAYRDFPLREIHPQAQIAAEGGNCAAEQGKFWEFHDAVFGNAKLDENGLAESAKGIGIDETKFRACLSSGKFRSKVDADQQDGAKAGVSGTPAFFINGSSLEGSQPLSAFEKVIDAELAAKGVRTAGPVK